jgi:RNA polymerase sigma-70 factor (ECF subfamily)
LALLDQIDLSGYYVLHASRADLVRRLGRRREAGESYRLALSLVTNEVERRYLERRLAQVTAYAN